MHCTLQSFKSLAVWAFLRKERPSLIDFVPLSPHIVKVVYIAGLMDSPYTPGFFAAPCMYSLAILTQPEHNVA
jgi:hypothetical protein